MILDPGNTAEITEIFAVVSRDQRGNEGLVAIGALPLISNNIHTVTAYLPQIRARALCTDKTIHVLRFSEKSEVDL